MFSCAVKKPSNDEIVSQTANTSDGTGPFDLDIGSNGGRKVIYRDLSATFKAVNQHGIVAIKICVNQAGLVTFAEIINEETTMKDKKAIDRFL